MLTRRQLLVIGITAAGVGVVSGCEGGPSPATTTAPTATRTSQPPAAATPSSIPTPELALAPPATRDLDGRFPLDPGDRVLPDSLSALSAANAAEASSLSRLGLGTLWDIAFSPDGEYLVIGTGTGLIQFREAVSGKEVARWLAHDDLINIIAFSPDGRLLASGGRDEVVRLWDPRNGSELYTLEGHIDAVRGVVFSLDGKLLASAGEDGTIRLWDPETGGKNACSERSIVPGNQCCLQRRWEARQWRSG